MSRLDPRRDRRLSPPLDRDAATGSRPTSRSSSKQAAKPIDPSQAHQRARQPHHRGAGDRPRLSRPLQRQEQRRHHQPAGRRDHRDARASSTASASTWSPASRCRKPAPRPASPRSTCSACRSHAAMTGDIDLLKLAVLHDPLVGAICTPEEVWQMVDEMVVAQAAVAAAICPCHSGRARSGWRNRRSRPATGQGAARRDVRSIEELRAEKAALKQAGLERRGRTESAAGLRRERRRIRSCRSRGATERRERAPTTRGRRDDDEFPKHRHSCRAGCSSVSVIGDECTCIRADRAAGSAAISRPKARSTMWRATHPGVQGAARISRARLGDEEIRRHRQAAAGQGSPAEGAAGLQDRQHARRHRRLWRHDAPCHRRPAGRLELCAPARRRAGAASTSACPNA